MLATKREMVERIAEKVGVTGQQAKAIVQATLDDMVLTLAQTGRIELRNFGVFTVKVRAARKARNPRSGETVMIGERRVVKFKPGKVMETTVQKMQQLETA
jgi:nucleoid DNA-binding protein